MTLDGQQHVAEPAQHMRADRLRLESARQIDHCHLIDRDREMIRPEMHKPFDKGCRRLKRRCRAGGHGLQVVFAGVALQCLARGLLVCVGSLAHRPLRVEVLRQECFRSWKRAPGLTGRDVLRELVQQPAPAIGRDRIIRPGAEAETIEGDARG